MTSDIEVAFKDNVAWMNLIPTRIPWIEVSVPVFRAFGLLLIVRVSRF